MTTRRVFSPVTLFPAMFDALRDEGVIARARARGLLEISPVQLRDFSDNARRDVDDHPVGGGDGMVLRADVAARALGAVLTPSSTLISVTPTGKVFDNATARVLAERPHLVFLCGRYAGFDDRLFSKFPALELSIGDFVLSGGELPSMCMMDAIARFIPGVLGNDESAHNDSFSDALLEAPSYTKPLDFEGVAVPEILLSGNHEKIRAFRRKQQLARTARNRPDLVFLQWDSLSRAEKALVEKIFKMNKGGV